MNIAIVSLLSAILLLTGCPSPNQKARQEHETKRDWSKPSAPEDTEVTAADFRDFALEGAYAKLKDPKGEVLNSVLIPLSRIVLNSVFVEDIQYHGVRLDQMINVFNRAFLRQLKSGDRSAEFLKMKEDYFQTVFSGCRADLSNSDCVNAKLFSNDGFHTAVMAALAVEYDAPIANVLKTFNGSIKECISPSPEKEGEAVAAEKITAAAECRSLIEKRYRLLAMGARKTNRNDDADYTFAYLKFARGFAYLIDYDRANPRLDENGESLALSSGYISQSHTKIFETLIAQFDPQKADPVQFKEFVENFNPWTYSALQASVFRAGTRIMFGFGAGCCLYDDAGRTKASKGVIDAIVTTQQEPDAFGPSFTQMVSEIGDPLFKNMGMTKELATLRDSKSAFYDEYFLIVDRMFRGHWSTEDVAMVLKSTNPARTRERLPQAMLIYVKVNLLYMVLETNNYMGGIYRSEIAASKVFEYATQRSRNLTTRWHTIQAAIDLINSSLGSYLNGQNLKAEDHPVFKMIVAVNRTVHYIAVNTNMIAMTYFLSKMSGTLTFQAWYGPVTVDAGSILDSFFDGGLASPWFVFGKDKEPLDRHMLLFSWEYLLSTRALDQFSTKEGLSPEEERGLFFDRIFSGYLDGDIQALRKLKTDFERTSEGSAYASLTQVVCDYEMGKTRSIPTIAIDFMDLRKYTYGGIGGNSINLLLNKRLTEPMQSFQVLRGRLDSRLTYLRAMIDIIEADLQRTMTKEEYDAYIATGKPHRTTQMYYDKKAEVDELQRAMAKIYHEGRREALDCMTKLQEIERRRINRLYQEERDHLGRVFDMIAPLMKIQDPIERDKQIAELSKSYFRNPQNGYRFDTFVGPSYMLSQYDLYKRIQRHIEGDSFFKNRHPVEDLHYGTAKEDSEYMRPRQVRVIEGDGVEREPIVANQTAKFIQIRDGSAADRTRFINESMAVFNGEHGMFVDWQTLRAGDSNLLNAVNTMVEFHLMGPVTDIDGKVYSITAAEIADTYLKTIASYTLDPMDLISAKELKTEGRFGVRFFQFRTFEANGARLPLFFQLENEVRGRAQLQQDATANQGEQALAFARALNNLRAFVFEPSPQVRASVKRLYGDRSNGVFQRAAEIYEEIARLQQEYPDPAVLDPRLVQPSYVQNGTPVHWYVKNGRNALNDLQKRADFKFLFDDFIRRTNNFYETREKVKFQ